MRYLFILLLISTCAFPQTQGDTPNIVDGAIDGILTTCGQGCITWPEPFVSGDTYAFCMTSEQLGGPFPISDTLGDSYTCTTPTTTPAPETGGSAGMCYTKATHSGPNIITIVFPSGDGQMSGAHFHNVGAVDGAVATATFAGVGAGGVGSITTNKTTTANNDLLVSCTVTSIANTGSWLSSDSTGEVGASEAQIPYLSFKRAGTAGAKSSTDNTWNGPTAFGGNTTFAKQTLAFKPDFPASSPTSIVVTDTKLPDAGSGVVYEADLHCAGGVAAQSFILTGSLPVGLSFNTTTGKITGTTLFAGTVSLGFQCTDGITTSALKTLPLTIGASLLTPSVRQYVSTFDAHTGTFAATVCGDMLHGVFRGTDTHSDAGWVQTIDGASNKIFDSFGSPVQRMPIPIAGNAHTAINDYVIGPLTSSGADTVTGANNQSANSGLQISGLYDMANIQSVSDEGSQANAMMQNGTLSVSYTTTVPNTMLLTAMTSMQAGGGGGLAFSLGAPWVIDSNGGDTFGHSIYAHTLVSSPSTVTATYTVSGAAFFAPFSAVMIPLRPRLPIVACGEVTASGRNHTAIF